VLLLPLPVGRGSGPVGLGAGQRGIGIAGSDHHVVPEVGQPPGERAADHARAQHRDLHGHGYEARTSSAIEVNIGGE
jgi:hypothetical protein